MGFSSSMADAAITVPAHPSPSPNRTGNAGLGQRKPLQSYLDLFTIPEGIEGDEEDGSHVVVPEVTRTVGNNRWKGHIRNRGQVFRIAGAGPNRRRLVKRLLP